MTIIEEYLKALSKFNQGKNWPYQNLYDFLIKEGQQFTKIHDFRETGYERGEAKNCYGNSYQIAVMDNNINYCEGIAVAHNVPLPMAHAWNYIPGLGVVDSTWKNGVEYFGVVIPKWYLTQLVLNSSRYGVLDAWDLGWPLLSGKHKWPLTMTQVNKAGWERSF